MQLYGTFEGIPEKRSALFGFGNLMSPVRGEWVFKGRVGVKEFFFVKLGEP